MRIYSLLPRSDAAIGKVFSKVVRFDISRRERDLNRQPEAASEEEANDEASSSGLDQERRHGSLSKVDSAREAPGRVTLVHSQVKAHSSSEGMRYDKADQLRVQAAKTHLKAQWNRL